MVKTFTVERFSLSTRGGLQLASDDISTTTVAKRRQTRYSHKSQFREVSYQFLPYLHGK